MLNQTPRFISQSLLASVGVKLSICHQDRLPQNVPVIVASNHRSFLDAPILIDALPTPLRIACHHYMEKTPILREMVHLMGCFPLAEAVQRKQKFFERGNSLLTSRQWVGLFPEGAQPMVEPTKPNEMGKFHRGFAHLAWKTPVENVAVLPLAIASLEETILPTIPIRWLRQFDATEPFFQKSGFHPMVVYHRVNLLVGRPYWISREKKREYKGKQAKVLASDLTAYCQQQIQELLDRGCY